jgi:hypothetical protein
MPFVNDQYVDYDPDVLANAIITGSSVRPHYYDYEDTQTRKKRTADEYEQISRALWRKNQNAWYRWHMQDILSRDPRELPEELQPVPYNDWNKIQARGALAKTDTTQGYAKRYGDFTG